MRLGTLNLNDHYQEKDESEGILLENNNIGGFNEPVAASVGEEAGPFRSSGAILRRVEFDPKKLSRRERKFISSLPKGVAIVGGFARGMYLGDMRDVGDIDLAVKRHKERADNKNLAIVLSHFLSNEGYKVLYLFLIEQEFGQWPEIRSILEVSDRYSYKGFNVLGDEVASLGMLMRKWNGMPLKAKHFWGPRRTTDVLIASPEHELLDFLNLFDISICQFAYLNGGLYATEAALEDVAQKRFHVLRDTDPNRARKYWKKGYDPVWDDLMIKVMRIGVFDQAFAELMEKNT